MISFVLVGWLGRSIAVGRSVGRSVGHQHQQLTNTHIHHPFLVDKQGTNIKLAAVGIGEAEAAALFAETVRGGHWVDTCVYGSARSYVWCT